MREVVWSSFAENQYLTALAYLSDRNEPAAAKFKARIEDVTNRLAKRPIGRAGYAVGTFENIVQQTSYVLVFELAGDELRIMRLFHMSQDWRGWRDEETDAQ